MGIVHCAPGTAVRVIVTSIQVASIVTELKATLRAWPGSAIAIWTEVRLTPWTRYRFFSETVQCLSFGHGHSTKGPPILCLTSKKCHGPEIFFQMDDLSAVGWFVAFFVTEKTHGVTALTFNSGATISGPCHPLWNNQDGSAVRTPTPVYMLSPFHIIVRQLFLEFLHLISTEHVVDPC